MQSTQAWPGAGDPESPFASRKTSQLFIQMEFCPRTLQQALQQGPLSEDDAWQVPPCPC